MPKVYFENKNWIVFLNSHNDIKVINRKTFRTYNYLKDIYGKEHDIPKYVVEKCWDLHKMAHDGSLQYWVANYKK